MSKRFGRNQKRKLRESLEGRIKVSESRSRDLEDRLSVWARDIVSLMGHDSAFNERIAIKEFHGDRYSYSRFPMVSLDFGKSAYYVDNIIQAAIWRLNVTRDEYQDKIRVLLSNRNGDSVGYVVSIDHRWTDKDARYIAEDITKGLINAIPLGTNNKYTSTSSTR